MIRFTQKWQTHLGNDLHTRALAAAGKAGTNRSDWLRMVIEDAVKKSERAKS